MRAALSSWPSLADEWEDTCERIRKSRGVGLEIDRQLRSKARIGAFMMLEPGLSYEFYLERLLDHLGPLDRFFESWPKGQVKVRAKPYTHRQAPKYIVSSLYVSALCQGETPVVRMRGHDYRLTIAWRAGRDRHVLDGDASPEEMTYLRLMMNGDCRRAIISDSADLRRMGRVGMNKLRERLGTESRYRMLCEASARRWV